VQTISLSEISDHFHNSERHWKMLPDLPNGLAMGADL